MVNARSVAGFLAAALLAGCAAPDPWHYEWGSYEASVRAVYAHTSVDNKATTFQIQQLESEIQKSLAHQKPNEPSRIPPGKYAHLGYLYTVVGDQHAAERCFQSEKTIYPESTAFIDGILQRNQRTQ